MRKRSIIRHITTKILLWACFAHSICGLRSPTVKLSNGYEMPVVGFGTHFRTPTEELEAVLAALETGYRHFDTAYAYKNEKNLGNALKIWLDRGGRRDEVYVSTKLPVTALRAEDVELALNESLNNLGVDYLDLYLIHAPFGLTREDNFDIKYLENGTVALDYGTDLVAVWKEMEKQVYAGRVRSIGLSNCNQSQVLRIWNSAEIKPVNLQIEGNAYLQQKQLRAECKKLGIVVTAYSPLGSSDVEHVRRKKRSISSPLKHPSVLKIADSHNVTAGQVLLRYLVDIGFAVIPKSGNPRRMRENLDLFGFALTREDKLELQALDQGGTIRKFDFQTLLKGVEKHPEYPFVDKIPKNN